MPHLQASTGQGARAPDQASAVSVSPPSLIAQLRLAQAEIQRAIDSLSQDNGVSLAPAGLIATVPAAAAATSAMAPKSPPTTGAETPPARSRTALGDLAHTPQPASPLGMPSASSARLAALEKENARLRGTVAEMEERHGRETRAWTAFKAWWLEAVEKRERRRRNERGQRPERKAGPRISDKEKQLWARAGVDRSLVEQMLRHDPDDQSNADVTTASASTSASKAAVNGGKELEGGEEGWEQGNGNETDPSSSLQVVTAPIQPSAADAPAKSAEAATPALARHLPWTSKSERPVRHADSLLVPASPTDTPSRLRSSNGSLGGGEGEASTSRAIAAATTVTDASKSEPRLRPLRLTADQEVDSAQLVHRGAGVDRTNQGPIEAAPRPRPASPVPLSAAPSTTAALETPSQCRRRIVQARTAELATLRADPYKHKGKGRYAREIPVAGAAPNLNAEFAILAERNGGVTHAFVGSERNRSKRKQMHALDCDCCRDYWENVGVMPKPGPVRRSDDGGAAHGRDRQDKPQRNERPTTGTTGATEEESQGAAQRRRVAEVQAHKQAISRHRDWGIPETTPPGYWNITFPTTQEQHEINRQAEEERRKKRQRIESDPRYVRR